ncbi:hypothetical protein GCM10012275_06620 [Longimycelium tulufanense]|uniref:Alpha/beta hydrolase n=1 Tax=Longimycelium tulufanense TaxID=907463 RepID=A0A8J3C686_9PSEU|nr:alpha/beta hydrolase [Longimycelium tulufanense]GGM38273.1 hypothetical protein GCM10012275_06620 [Longimycelium tulufanense]
MTTGSMTLARRLFLSGCMLTKTTEFAARRLGAGFFLPALFVLRYANMGGIDPDLFAGQLAQARSFTDDRWCAYWDEIAATQVAAADRALRELADPSAPTVRGLLDADDQATVTALGALLAPASPILADHGPQATTDAIERIAREKADGGRAATERLAATAKAVDALVKAITYFQVSAFPGGSPARMRAYTTSRRLFGLLAASLTPGLSGSIERIAVPVDGDIVQGYAAFPAGTRQCPVVLATNGLEGTAQELLIPLLKYRDTGMGIVAMERPGTYAYRRPMSATSERIYHQVIEHLAGHPRVDAERIGMVGVSFGGYWSARMAATNPRLRCAVACGAPTHRTFQPAGSVGIPEIIVQALHTTTGATNLLSLARKLRTLSLRGLYERITIPLLVINGDHDTLVSTHDSVELAQQAPAAILRLYPDDDHCAMGHYNEWLDRCQTWLQDHLTADATEQP